jgi:transcriptional regulator with XRE-family HTH domain
VVGVEVLFRRRVRQLIQRKYRSLDRFYLETDFSKGHLSEILRGKGSPSVGTLVKLAHALEVDVREFFVFPDRGTRDRALDLVGRARPEALQGVIRLLSEDAE